MAVAATQRRGGPGEETPNSAGFASDSTGFATGERGRGGLSGDAMRDKSTFDKDCAFGHLILRLALGVNLLGHGLIRLPKIPEFRDWMTGVFATGPLPIPMVGAFATVLPAIEALIGLALVLGWKTRSAAVAAGALMVCLIFGSCTLEKWEWAGGQMLYALFAGLLLLFLRHDRYSLDTLLRRRADA